MTTVSPLNRILPLYKLSPWIPFKVTNLKAFYTRKTSYFSVFTEAENSERTILYYLM